MLSAFFVTILISLASGIGLELSDTVQNLFVRVHNDDIRIEVNNSPIPTVAALLTTATPTPTVTPRSSADDFSGPTPTNCNFEYHKEFKNGEPVSIEHNCTSTTEGNGSSSSSVNIEANSSGGGNTSGHVNVDISVKTK